MHELTAIFRPTSDGARTMRPSPPPSWKAIVAAFPHLALAAGGRGLPALAVTARDWTSPFFNLYDFDGRLDALAEEGGPFAVTISDAAEESLPRTACEVLTRCQRWGDRRNASSRTALFARVLSAHRAAHDLSKPLVRADYDHALDTWQWALRLAPDASLALQLAALLHDIERLESEADERRETGIAGRRRDYQRYKDEHARRGAEIADRLLADAGAPAAVRQRTARLVAAHERRPDPGPHSGPHLGDSAGETERLDLGTLNDADALSFFALNCAGYLDCHGAAAAGEKVAFTLRRLSAPSRRHLSGMRLPPEVAQALTALRETEAAGAVA